MRLRCAVMMGVVIGMLASAPHIACAAPVPAERDDGGNETANQVIDDAGRIITVEHPFQRIISLYGAHTENLFSLGAGGQVIGVARHDDWPPETAAKPVFSYHDDLEKFLAARPDLVLIRPMIDRGYAQLVLRLEQHGIRVVSLQPTTVKDMLVYWRALGILAGRQAAALDMVARFEQTTARIRRITGAIPDKKRVYFEAIHDRMRTFAPHAMAVYALETAGGINLAADAQARRGTNIADYSKERILAKADHIDVFLAQSGRMNRITVEELINEPGFGAIKAIRTGRVHLIDEDLVARPTPRLLEGIELLNRLLYP
jgi:iron complex transport system substrate-binding protein